MRRSKVLLILQSCQTIELTISVECLRVFTRFPQTSKVFFGGAHDNGYISILNQLQNEGLRNKLVVLRGYKELAYELKNLKLPTLEIVGLFMTEKLQTIAPPRKHSPPSLVKPQDFEKFRATPQTSSPREFVAAKAAQFTEKGLVSTQSYTPILEVHVRFFL